MRIFIFGNLNSGKTQLARKLLPYFSGYNHLSLDEFRKRYSDGSLDGEQKAVSLFVREVTNQPDAIIDFTGCGSVTNLLQKQLPCCCGIMLVCTRKPDDCIKEIETAKYDSIPYPSEYKQSESLVETVQRLSTLTTEEALLKEWQAFIWQSYEITFAQDIYNHLPQLALEHHKTVGRIKNLAVQQQSWTNLITYGSLGANTLTPQSDLDFFLRTDLSPAEIKAELETHFTNQCIHSDLLGDKITLRMRSGLLVEVVCGKELEETALYYRESQIKNVRLTVLKGDQKTIEQLEQFVQQHPAVAERAASIAAELYFLFCSLPKLIEIEDSYKYAFHTYIMQHFAVQLESLLSSNPRHNYLPKQAVQSLPDFPWDCFTVSPVEINHSQYQSLRNYLQELFIRLAENHLIEGEKYFTPETSGLH